MTSPQPFHLHAMFFGIIFARNLTARPPTASTSRAYISLLSAPSPTSFILPTHNTPSSLIPNRELLHQPLTTPKPNPKNSLATLETQASLKQHIVTTIQHQPKSLKKTALPAHPKPRPRHPAPRSTPNPPCKMGAPVKPRPRPVPRPPPNSPSRIPEEDCPDPRKL